MGLDIYFELKNSKDTSEVIGYFRKVNFLVKFFNCPELDNCKPITINRCSVEYLIECCEKVLENPELASELLPTMDGFFFGDTDYNEYYFEDVEEVLDYCKNKLLPIFDELKDDKEILFEIWY